MMFRFLLCPSPTLLLPIVVALFYCVCTAVLAKNATFPALIVFGDSIVDPGNNNYINTLIKCDFPPYGRDFLGGKSTGRFCNGKVPSDLTAEFYGIKELVPPYLDPNLEMQDLLTGVSFASGGTGYDPLTAKIVSVLSLSDQLEMFKEYKEKIKSSLREEQTTTLISKSLFFVCCGSDDIANTYFSSPFRRPHYSIDAYTDLGASSASQFYQDLYELGARKVIVLGIPPIGCLPSQRTLAGGSARDCANLGNKAAAAYNSRLSSQIASLRNKIPDYKIFFLDVYNLLMSIIEHPSKYGFQEVNKGCCGTGSLEVSILCNRFSDQRTCTDASKYVFWDSYHPTEKTYKILTPSVLNQHTKDLL